MTKRKTFFLLSPFFLILLTSLVGRVYAGADVNLLDIPENLGERLGVSTFAGGIIASAILLMAMMLPTALISRLKQTGFLPELIMGLIGLSISIAIGWLNYWFLLVICLIIALLFAGRARDFLSGG